MTVAPESSKPEIESRGTCPQTDGTAALADSSVAAPPGRLPNVLYAPAYISSGGRVYRLFSESEEEATLHSVPKPVLAEPVDAIPIAETASPQLALAVLDDIEEELAGGPPPNISLPRVSSPQSPSILPLPIADRRRRAVEGRFAGQQKQAETVTLPVPSVSKSVLRTASPPPSITLDLQNSAPTETRPESETTEIKTLEPKKTETIQAASTPSIKRIRLDIKWPRVGQRHPLPFTAPRRRAFPPEVPSRPQESTEENTGSADLEPTETVLSAEPLTLDLDVEPVTMHDEAPKDEKAFGPPGWQPHWPPHLASLNQQAANQIQNLSDHLEMLMERGEGILCFHGYRPGEGCTTLALCAARELAERGHRVLLADAQRHHPELPTLLELEVDPQHYEIMSLIPDRLDLLPWSESCITEDSEDEPSTKTFGEIVSELRYDYDAILLDGGALIASPLAGHLTLWRQTQSDGVILVVNTKHPKEVSVPNVSKRLRQNHVELLGVAENYV